MKLAVKFYKAGNEQGLPVTWPSECRELEEDATLPDGFDVLMTPEELGAHKIKHRADYNAWVDVQNKEREEHRPAPLAFKVQVDGSLDTHKPKKKPK